MTLCAVCGGSEWSDRQILWPALIAEWQLSEAEVRYIDRQQGTSCVHCGSNLRSAVLAEAILEKLNLVAPLKQSISSLNADLKILELNEAGSLSRVLAKHAGHLFAAYPEVDMQRLPYLDASFDLVIHSDTLEHVPDPVKGLSECHRVLKPGGHCIFTVPVVVGRLSASREGKAPSYHGNPESAGDDLIVHTEYGADAWIHVVRAGFRTVEIRALDYPSALAFACRRA